MVSTTQPYAIRFNEADKSALEYLEARLGLAVPQIVRLALQRLQQTEKKLEGNK